MDSNVEYLVCHILLSLQQESCALLKLSLESMNRIKISDLAMLNFFPEKLRVVEQEADMLLAEAYDLNLLIKLLSLSEALAEKFFTIFLRKLGVLREFDR